MTFPYPFLPPIHSSVAHMVEKLVVPRYGMSLRIIAFYGIQVNYAIPVHLTLRWNMLQPTNGEPSSRLSGYEASR